MSNFLYWEFEEVTQSGPPGSIEMARFRGCFLSPDLQEVTLREVLPTSLASTRRETFSFGEPSPI